MIAIFKIDPWVRRPQCRASLAVADLPLAVRLVLGRDSGVIQCENTAHFQCIDDSKRGTSEYCSYVCEDHGKQHWIN